MSCYVHEKYQYFCDQTISVTGFTMRSATRYLVHLASSAIADTVFPHFASQRGPLKIAGADRVVPMVLAGVSQANAY